MQAAFYIVALVGVREGEGIGSRPTSYKVCGPGTVTILSVARLAAEVVGVRVGEIVVGLPVSMLSLYYKWLE